MSRDPRKVVPLRRTTASPAASPLPPFAELLRGNLDAMYRVALHMIGSREDAREVVQDAALKAFRSYAGVRDGAAAKVWLFRVLVRAAQDRMRVEARSITFVDVPVDVVLGEASTSAMAEIRLTDRESLRAAFASLDPGFREVVWQVDGEGMTIQEVAEILGIPVGTAASRLYRGRQRLREQLAGEGGDGER